MPEFVIEVTSKITFGPYTYPTSAAVRNAIVAGDLKIDEVECNAPILIITFPKRILQ